MTWGVFPIRDESGSVEAVHIMPIDSDGFPRAGYEFSPYAMTIQNVIREAGCAPVYVHGWIQ